MRGKALRHHIPTLESNPGSQNRVSANSEFRHVLHGFTAALLTLVYSILLSKFILFPCRIKQPARGQYSQFPNKSIASLPNKQSTDRPLANKNFTSRTVDPIFILRQVCFSTRIGCPVADTGAGPLYSVMFLGPTTAVLLAKFFESNPCL